jgi:membrane-associated protease RseP (regulator of RpoE activity)
MKHFLRPYRNVGILVLLGTGAGMVMGPPVAAAQSTQVVELLEGTNPLLLHSSSSQGYLGVWVDDVDADKAQTLKLKEVRGAVITLIDHDAPAGQIGLHVNDVVLQLNGQNVEGAEQLRRMLREIPPGRKVSMEFSRDGNLQTTSVQLVDRRVMEHDVWNKLGKDSDVFAPATGMGVLAGGGDGSLPGMFHMPIFGSTLNVGAMVEPLTSQMAEYLGVSSGLMVKQVAHKSEAAASGLKAFDVILKVGPDAVTTLSDWDRALRSNQGKPVQVTILRDKKQQTLTMQVDSKHKTGALEMEELFPSGNCPVVAELDPNALQLFAQDNQAAASRLRDRAQTLKDQMKQFAIGPQQAEELRKQAENFRDQLKIEDFKIDQKQLDELKQHMDQFQHLDRFQQNFKLEDPENAPM